MPDLPALPLSQEHFDRVVAAFPGETLAKKAENYKVWLTNHLIDFVEQTEARVIDEEANALKTQKLQQMHASLPDKQPWPPVEVV